MTTIGGRPPTMVFSPSRDTRVPNSHANAILLQQNLSHPVRFHDMKGLEAMPEVSGVNLDALLGEVMAGGILSKTFA